MAGFQVPLPGRFWVPANIHAIVDEFFYIERGKAEIVLNGKETHTLKSGDAALVPAGTHYNVINGSRTGKLKFYTIFSPPSQPAYTIFKTKAEAEKAGSKVQNTDWGAGTGYL